MPLLFLLFAFSVIAFFMYKVLTSENIEEEKLHDVDQFIPEGIIEIEKEEYQNLALLNVYCSANDPNFDLVDIHSFGNGVFLAFEKNIWLNIMFNAALGIFQINKIDPFSLALEYELMKLNEQEKWRPVVGQKVTAINLELEKEATMVLPKNLHLKFEAQEVFVCWTNEITEAPRQLEFGVDWLAIIFSEEKYIELRK